MKTLPNLKDKPFGGAWSVHDPETVEFVKNNTISYPDVNLKLFLDDYAQWATTGHNLRGIDDYNDLSYCNGTTEAFDKFYHKHRDRRLRLWRGEYFYHQIQAREIYSNNFSWIDDEPVGPMDVVVVSAPFSDTGNVPYKYDSVLAQCENLGVPVLIDMAYLNLTKNFTIDLSYKCIQTVTTSMSKVFPVETHRIGIRMNRHSVDDTLSAYTNNSVPYVNSTSVHLGHQLIKQYNNLWLYYRYKFAQDKMCAQTDVVASDCVIFGIDVQDKWSEYNRGALTNRLCFSRLWDKRI